MKGTYKLAATYCEPDSGPGHTLQILTHGVGFDRSYWDLPFNKHSDSYVATAVDDHGYSTLTWDRLGVGASSKGDPVSEIQVFLEIAALKALTEKAKAGKLCTKQKHKYHSIAHVGHSYGSAMTYNFANLYPELTQGIILQGFSQAPGYLNYFALAGNFVPVSKIKSLKGKYPRGYLGVESSVGVHSNFFAPGDFDPKALEFAYKTQQAFTPGEILTVGAGLGNTNTFKGPVMIITGGKPKHIFIFHRRFEQLTDLRSQSTTSPSVVATVTERMRLTTAQRTWLSSLPNPSRMLRHSTRRSSRGLVMD